MDAFGSQPDTLAGGHDLGSVPSVDRYAGAGRGSTALVVEDDFGSRLALTALLERSRLTVIAADSGQAALDTLQQRDDVGIVLMDIMMPSMDGYEAMSAIRQRPEHAGLPIIAVTAKDGEGESARCLVAGASRYIPKPIEAAKLLTAVGELLTNAGSELSDGDLGFSGR
jgi:CheY-like chemotaxis protein